MMMIDAIDDANINDDGDDGDDDDRWISQISKMWICSVFQTSEIFCLHCLPLSLSFTC